MLSIYNTDLVPPFYFPGCSNENEPTAADPLIKETEEDEETGRPKIIYGTGLIQLYYTTFFYIT